MGGGADDQQIGTMSPRKIDQDGGLVLAFRGQRMNRHVEAVTAEVAGDVGARLRAMALRACFGVDDEDIDLRAGLGELQRIAQRSEEHMSELQSLMRISYAVFCLQTKNTPSTFRQHP